MTVHERIREARIAAGFKTGSAFARALGITTGALWRYETANTNPHCQQMPSPGMLARIADLVGRPVEWLRDGNGPKSRKRAARAA
jgi:transcriptional regulator with XRE-family HTH domain